MKTNRHFKHIFAYEPWLPWHEDEDLFFDDGHTAIWLGCSYDSETHTLHWHNGRSEKHLTRPQRRELRAFLRHQKCCRQTHGKN